MLHTASILHRHATPGLPLILLLLAGCPDKDEGFVFKLPSIAIPSPSCPNQSIGSAPPSLSAKDYTVRVTFLQRKPGKVTAANIRNHYNTACWRVIPPGVPLDFLVPEGTQQPYTVVIDAFKNRELHYAGRAEQMTIGASGTGTVFMRPTIKNIERYTDSAVTSTKRLGLSCVDTLLQCRAFHTATLLPNGEVLIYGGLKGDEQCNVTSNDTLSAVDTVEIYHPNYEGTRSFEVLTQKVPPRAFHQAMLLPSDPAGPYRLLLVGGLSGPAPTSPVVSVAAGTKPFMFTPLTNAVAATALLVTYDPGVANHGVHVKELTTLPQAMFPAVALRGNRLAMAGGAATFTATGPAAGFTGEKSLHWIDLREDGDPVESVQTLVTNNVRVGHALALLGDGDQIVLGGQMDGLNDQDGEYLPSASATSLTPFAVPRVPVITAPVACAVDSDCAAPTVCINLQCVTNMASVWHTLTPLGRTDKEIADGTYPIQALWAGGLVLTKKTDALRETGPAPEPRPQQQALAVVQKGLPPIVVSITTDNAGSALPGHFVTAGYHEAATLYDGSVLLVGGKLGHAGTACGVASPFCASNQIVIYAQVNNTLQLTSPATGYGWALSTPRMGHRLTRLLDNSVLITGGITLVGSAGQMLKSVELFNPRTGDPTEDVLGRASPTEAEQAPVGEICPSRYGE